VPALRSGVGVSGWAVVEAEVAGPSAEGFGDGQGAVGGSNRVATPPPLLNRQVRPDGRSSEPAELLDGSNLDSIGQLYDPFCVGGSVGDVDAVTTVVSPPRHSRTH
jgi:hypothetical protein